MSKYDASKMIKKNATIYFSGEMLGTYHRIQVRAFYVETGVQYAQYPNAVALFFIAKSQRTVKAMIQTYRPSLLILDGWGHPKPDDMWGPEEVHTATGLVTKRSKYSAFDEGWKKDFDTMIGAHITAMTAARKSAGLPEAVILHDFRGHDSMAAAPAAPAPAPTDGKRWKVYSKKTVTPFSAVEEGAFPTFGEAMDLFEKLDVDKLGRLEVVGPDGYTRHSRGTAAQADPTDPCGCGDDVRAGGCS